MLRNAKIVYNFGLSGCNGDNSSLNMNSMVHGARWLGRHALPQREPILITVKILKFGTPQTIAIIVPKIEKFDVTLH